VAEAQGQFGSSEGGEYQPLEAGSRGMARGQQTEKTERP
jgi:hypothetical protein